MDSIQTSEARLVVQPRTLPIALREEVAKLAEGDDLRIVLHGSIERIGDELQSLFDDCPALLSDLRAQLDRFSDLAGTPSARLRIERIAGDACRRWHADNVVLRLLCTYVGPGTELLPMPEAAPVLAGAEPASTASAWSVGTGDVVMLPGRRHPRAVPAVHRSPPIAGTGAVRLLLVIDDDAQVT